jgi:hypothetical protein
MHTTTPMVGVTSPPVRGLRTRRFGLHGRRSAVNSLGDISCSTGRGSDARGTTLFDLLRTCSLRLDRRRGVWTACSIGRSVIGNLLSRAAWGLSLEWLLQTYIMHPYVVTISYKVTLEALQQSFLFDGHYTYKIIPSK